MNIAENVYQCSSCRRPHPNSLAALACHRRGWIRRPVPLREYNLDIPGLLILASMIASGFHNN